ncbi:histone acetyltransferase 1, partial [Cladochytrium tenue]
DVFPPASDGSGKDAARGGGWGATADERRRTFAPEFTYQLFDDEKAFGYKGLKIRLHLAAATLHAYLGVTYAARVDEASGSKRQTATAAPADDVAGPIALRLAGRPFESYVEFAAAVRRGEQTFRPLGEKVHEYRRAGGVFEVYKATFATPGFREYHARMQVLLLFFIEAASFIDDTDEGWEVYTVYERRGGDDDAGLTAAGGVVDGGPRYAFAGYCTVYPFYFHPFKRRMRI